MKQLPFFLTVSFLFTIITHSCSQTNDANKRPVLATFVASTPCSQGTRPLPGIEINAPCELMKWRLTLYQDGIAPTPNTSVALTPNTFELRCLYGLPRQGTSGINQEKKITITGSWSVDTGHHSNPRAAVYKLKDDKSNKIISFLQLSDGLLHLLDSDQQLMIGTAAWNYTLSKIPS